MLHLRFAWIVLLTTAISQVQSADPQLKSEQKAKASKDNVFLRGNLDNSKIQFAQAKKGHVAFLGGSITEMNGYRPMVMSYLQQRFPDTAFTFTNAGISSTCSTTGAFRLQSDVLSKGPVDLFFVEFAVNDDQDAHHSRKECIRGMEGIVRQLRKHNPSSDIVITYFVNPSMLATIQDGQTPLPVESHNAVANQYQISTIYLAKEVADQIAAKQLTWKQFGGTHPAKHGNAICAKMIEHLLGDAWEPRLKEGATQQAHPFPAEAVDPLHYGNGRFVSIDQAKTDERWEIKIPTWKQLPGSARSRFANIPMLVATQPGAELLLKFQGTAVGIYVVAGPDAGVVEASIDGKPHQDINLHHRFSKGLHYPRTVMLGTELKPGEHILKLRISQKSQSKGNAVRIIQFTAN